MLRCERVMSRFALHVHPPSKGACCGTPSCSQCIGPDSPGCGRICHHKKHALVSGMCGVLQHGQVHIYQQEWGDGVLVLCVVQAL